MSKTRVVLMVVIVSCLLLPAQITPLVSGGKTFFGQTVPKITGLTDGLNTVSLQSRVLTVPKDTKEALAPLTKLASDEQKRLIVQLNDIPDADGREALAANGVNLLQYVGKNTWYAAIAGSSGAKTLQEQGVKAVWTIEPTDRLAPVLYKGKIPAHAVQKDGSVALTILAFDDADLKALMADVESAGGVIDALSAEFGTLFVHIPPQLVWGLGLIDGVHWVEPVAPPPAQEMDRARAYLGVDIVQAAPFSLTGAGVKVSVHDSSHALRHTDYTNRWIKDADALSVGMHPSMTAGTIAGDGTITPGFKGMAPGATIHTFNFSGGQNCCQANNFADIVTALQAGVDIANNSWGFDGCHNLPYGDYTSSARVFDLEVLGKSSTGAKVGKPTIVVFSGGNERDGFGDNNTLDCISETSGSFRNYGTVNQPKPAKNIITVGAVDSANDQMSSFSSWGPTTDGRIKPDFVAPGLHNGTSSASVSSILGQDCFGHPVGSANQQCYRTTSNTNTNAANTTFDDRYAWFSQTSAAAAMVSGSSALFVEDFRAGNPGHSPLPSTVKAHFIHTARDLNDSTTWYNAGPDYASGYGVVQVDKAIAQLRTKNWSEAKVDQGQTNTFFMNVPANATEVKLTLAWDDAPADPTTSTALVNDLDLIVTDPNGNRAFPWTLDPANPSNAAVRTAEDHVNNVEVVTINSGNIPAGLWRVQVKGTSVPAGPQTYSLVYSHPPVGGHADLLVTSVQISISGFPFSPSVVLSSSTRNEGPDTALPSVTRFYLSRNTTFEAGDLFLGQRSIPSLSPGQTSSSSIQLTIPNISPGIYFVLGVADATSAVTETFETNNTRAVQVNLTFPFIFP